MKNTYSLKLNLIYYENTLEKTEKSEYSFYIYTIGESLPRHYHISNIDQICIIDIKVF